jgi:hypothetical protein
MMRDKHFIETELKATQGDLERHVAELKQAVEDLAERPKELAAKLKHAIAMLRDHIVAVTFIAAGTGAVMGLVMPRRGRRRS